MSANRWRIENSISEITVSVTGVDIDTQQLICVNAYGQEFSVNASVRPKGVGLPALGERWTIQRRGQGWILGLCLTPVTVPTITGDQNTADPLSVQLLAAMAAHGLVNDQTIPLTVTVPPDPTPTIASSDPDYTATPTIPLDSEYDPTQVSEADPPEAGVPDSHNGPAPASTQFSLGSLIPLYLGTYNTNFVLGNNAVMADFKRLDKSRLQVFGTQELWSQARQPILDMMTSQGWSYYRPTTQQASECTIFWRTDQFKVLDQFTQQLLPPDPSLLRAPARNLNGVKLQQLSTGRVFWFCDTHLDTWKNASWSRIYSSVDQIRTKLAALRHGRPVFCAGDWNQNWLADSRTRDPRLPYSHFRSVGFRANWEQIPQRPTYGTMRNALIDTIWSNPQRVFRPTQQWILTGYHSDHRPVMVEYVSRATAKVATSSD